MNTIEIVIRSVLVFFILLVWARILGRKLISQMKFFDFVAGVTIGSMGGSLIFTRNIGLGTGIFALSAFSLLAIVSGLISLKSFPLRRVIDSGPVIIMRQGQILNEEMSKLRMTYNDLLMMLRKKDVFYLDEVELAVFETDGTLSVQRKTEAMPVSRQDMNISKTTRGVPSTFIMDGKLQQEGLDAIEKDINWVSELLKNRNIKSIHEVTLAQVDQAGTVYVDTRKDQTDALH